MLEKLTGPFSIHTDTDQVLACSFGNECAWDDDVGLILYTTDSNFVWSYLVTQMDGLCYMRSSIARAHRLVQDETNARREYLAFHSTFPNILYGFDKYACALKPVIDGSSGHPINYFSQVHVRLTSRYLSIKNGRVYSMPLNDPQVETIEHTFANNGSFGSTATYSRSKNENEITIVWANGQVVTYDYVQQTEVGTRKYLPANKRAWYSPRFDVFILIDTSNQLNIYASSPRPATLSNPVAVTSPVRGKRNYFKVQLLGAQGEPCSGEIIEWSITSGPGELEGSQSITQADGFAQIGYFAPVTLSTDVAIQAQMRF